MPKTASAPTEAIQTSILFLGVAVAEIAGCFAFWAWIRVDRSVFWLFPGIASLILFAVLLTLVDSEYAGRAYAAYGGVYIGSALLWLWVIEGQQPDLWDISGASLCLLGALVILFGPRSA